MKKAALLIFALYCCLLANAQRFEGGMMAGLNITQLDGDLLAGYNKAGLNGGFWLKYPLRKPWKLGVEFLFSQKGATRKIDENNISSTRTFDRFALQYLEVPFWVYYTYKKFTFGAGVSGGYLISAQVTDFTGKWDYKPFMKSAETALHFGVEYPLGPVVSICARWQYSVFSLAKNDNRNIFKDNALSPPILGLYNNALSVLIRYRIEN